jgi:nitrous oxidase accessory protein NosD
MKAERDDRHLEREVTAVLTSEAPSRPPDYLLESVLYNASRTRKHPRWLALIKEPPMRTSSSLAVGSPTARVAAILVATLLLAALVAGAGIAGSRLLAADGIIVVDPSGNGTVTTITEAVAMAQDGDEILVKPGTYRESVVIDKDITLRGEDRDSVVIELPADAPIYDGFWFGSAPYWFLLQESDAAISGLTFSGPVSDSGPNLVARGGGPLFQDIAMTGGNIYVHAGSAATVRDSELEGTWVFFEEQSPATIEDSRFAAVVANSTNTRTSGGPSTIRNNRTHGILIHGPALVEGNEVVAPEESLWPDTQYGSAIDVQGGDGWVIGDNTVTGFGDDFAINASRGRAGEITENVIVDSRTGIYLGAGSHEVVGNRISGGDDGILQGAGSSSITGNSVTGVSGRGFALGGSPVLRDNHSCGNGENLWIAEGATPDIDESNEICPDIAS